MRLADHRRTNFKIGPFDLGRRRDGRSDVWCATWYDATARTQRHRSLRTRDIEEAKRRLAVFAEANSHLPSRRTVTHAAIPTQIYFIGGEVGAVKIGLATDPVSRLVTLQCGSPIPLRIMATVAGDLRQEREYHARFSKHRLHGEWFERAPEILAEIERLSA